MTCNSQLAAVVAASMLVPSLAAAQAPAEPPFIEATRLSTVSVVDTNGVEHRGKIGRVDAHTLTLVAGTGERRFRREEIARIQKRGDSVKNGAAIGAIGGLAIGLITLAVSDCPSFDNSCDKGFTNQAGLVLANIGMYAAVATCVDALVKDRSLIYEAPRTQALGSRKPGPGIQFSLRW